jgi:hypothetical protein
MKKIFVPLIAGALLVTTAFPFAVQAGRGGGGPMGGPCLQTGAQNGNHLRLRDGSCLNGKTTRAGFGLRRGRGYGPGDCMGNAGIGPKDGTGYGARSQRRS